MTDFVSTTVSEMWGLSDLVTPIALRVAASLRIADHVASGVTSVGELAEATGTNPDALGRLLRYLATVGVLDETVDGAIVLTERGRVLGSDHPSRLHAWLDLAGFGGRLDRTMVELLEAVRTGGPVHDVVHGLPFWDDLAAHPDVAQSFDRLMGDQISASVPHIVRRYDWAEVHSVVDVGGGTGTLLAALAEANPQLRGVVVDLPGPAAAAAQRFAGSGLEDRCRAQPGSFFDPLPPGADAYVLATVLHDWNDADATRILANCRRAAAPGGRIVIIDNVADDQNPSAVAAMDLRMLVLFGGRERNLEDYEDLVSASGLTVTAVRPLPLWGKAILECRPA